MLNYAYKACEAGKGNTAVFRVGAVAKMTSACQVIKGEGS